MKINDKFIQSFFRICVKIYNYDGDNDVEIESFDNFLQKCDEKLSIIEDNELLNNEIIELSKHVNKITSKYNEIEKKYVNLYNDLRECRTELKSSIEEKDKLINNVNELFYLKTKHEKDIELKNQQLKQIKKKYNENKAFWKTILLQLEEQNINYINKNKHLLEQNDKYSGEIQKIEELKKTLCNKFSSDTIEKIDVSIVDMIERANEYEKKYKEILLQHEILKNNYDDLNGKYKELLLNQTNETNDLKQQIKLLMEQLEKDRKMYNDNIILMETKKQINENINNNQINEIQKGGENIKFFDIRDKKAIGYFEKDIKLFNENNDKYKNKEPTNRYKGEKINFTTDYMVDLLKVSEKVKNNNLNDNNTLGTIQEIDTIDSDTTDDEIVKKNNSIFMKNKEKYIDINKMKIVNESEENNINDGINLKKELDAFIKNNNDTQEIKQDLISCAHQKNDNIFLGCVNSVVYVGGGKKNKIEIRQIDDKFKMKFDNVFSTLTEQNINLNDDKLIKKIRHRKYMRHNREKNKLADLQDEIK